MGSKYAKQLQKIVPSSVTAKHFFYIVQSVKVRYRPRFFEQLWHQTIYASIGDKYFMSLSNLPKSKSSKIAKFWHSKSFFSIKNQRNLFDFFSAKKDRKLDNWTFMKLFFLLYFLKMCPIFVSSVHNFGRSDGDII